jgi:hypothetical protein
MSNTTRKMTVSGSVAGKNFSGPVERQGSGETNADVTLAAGVAATLTTRTDNTTGVVTLPPATG